MFSGKFQLPSADEFRSIAENGVGSVRGFAENGMENVKNMAESGMSTMNVQMSNLPSMSEVGKNLPTVQMSVPKLDLSRLRGGQNERDAESIGNGMKTRSSGDQKVTLSDTDQLLAAEEGSGVSDMLSSAGQSASSWFSNATGISMDAAEEEEEVWDVSYFCPDMSLKTRIKGFLICYSLGSVMLFLSSLSAGLILIRPSKFAFPYTIGSILSLGSSLFFVGPKKFAKTVFDPVRKMSTIVYILSLIGTLVTVLFLRSGILTFCMLVVQISSYLWLIASYVPYGRTMLLKLVNKIISLILGS
mmetsp:Transcript_5923/g.6808  ORF Transcript_5923/g.6808 Transcript_5923/m.6808 type:complete len:302 (+) Transcript_5923:211-1116(+)